MRPVLNVAWNIFLALIPVLIAWILIFRVRKHRREGTTISKAFAVPMLLVWVAFLPNTCYLLTEWRHYLEALTQRPMLYTAARHSAHFMFNFLLMTAFYAAYSGTGIVCYFLAIWPIDRWLHPTRFIKGAFFFLCSLGVYLGLIRRWNSWDFAHHPLRIFHDAGSALSSLPLALLIIGFAAALWSLYFVFGLTVDGLRQRLSEDDSPL
jgi:uncharacterized membrane protein